MIFISNNYMRNPKHYAKKNKANKKLYFLVLFPLVITGLFFYALYQVVTYIEKRDLEIFNTGYEAGRFDEVNQQDDYQSAKYINEYGELIHTPVEPKITPVKHSNYRADKDAILDKLAQIESGNGKVRKILDTNNRYSLGKWHFQAHSVKDMYKRYYGKNITIQEAVKIAEDDELARKLAHDAIFVKGEKFHWKISLCKMEVLTKGCLTQKQINSLFAKK